MLFCRRQPLLGKSVYQPSAEEIRNVAHIWNVDIEIARKNADPFTLSAIDKMLIKGDRKYIYVHSKIQFIAKGFLPSLPGWHVDGAMSTSTNKNWLDISAQDRSDVRPTHFHMLVTGNDCLTEFFLGQAQIDLPQEPITSFYFMDRQVSTIVQKEQERVFTVPSCAVVEFDWWNIHRAIVSQRNHWRFWIRVTETDYMSSSSGGKVKNQIYRPSV